MSKIAAVATVYESPELLPHFFRHYTALGADEIYLAANVANGPDLYDRARQYAEGLPVTVYPVFHDAFDDGNKDEGERRILDKRTTADDWILHLDVDEFHEYPAKLRTVCDALERAGVPLVSTDMVDRIAEDGSFPAVADAPSIGEQFPLGCRIVQKWMGLRFKKVLVCRGWVRLWAGRHSAQNAGVFAPPLGDWSQYRCHHFRWFKGWIERAYARDANDRLNGAYRSRNRRLADSVIDNRFDPAAVPDLERLGKLPYPIA